MSGLLFRGAYEWLQVGMNSSNGLDDQPDTLTIPMYMLRLKLDSLELDQHYVVISEDTVHSSAAVHILRQYGFKASVLQNVTDWPVRHNLVANDSGKL